MLIPYDRLVVLDKWFIDDWRRQLTRLWSIRIAVFWAAVAGLFAVWPAFQGVAGLPLWLFCGLSVLMSIGLVIARLTKQDEYEPPKQPSELDK